MKNKPKIAVIGLKGLPAFGGAAAVGENIINQLKERYDFTVLGVSSHTSTGNNSLNGIKQVVFKKFGKGSINTFVYYWKCLFYVLFRSFDLIHLHHAESGYITLFLKIRFKVIVTFHGIYNYDNPKFTRTQNRFFRFSEYLNTQFANEVVSVSYPDYLYFKQHKGKLINYIPNGITLTAELKKILQIKRDCGYILFAAGRIYKIKGLHLFIQAMKLINQDVKIKVAGDINQVADYKRLIENLSDGLNIEFLGLVKNKIELMNLVADASFFVFPSLAEAMSMMLLEVVSMKTPIIASDIPANKAIFNEKEVLFFQSNDTEDLKSKIEFALLNSEEMDARAEKAYNKLIKEYTWETISDSYDALYKKMID